METNSKSVFTSLTLWGVVVSTAASFFEQHTGVPVADQVKPAADAVAGIVSGFQAMAPAIGQLAGVIMVIVGRLRASQKLHVFGSSSNTGGGSSTSPIRSLSLLAMTAVIACGLGQTGCSATGASATSGNSTTTSTPSGTPAEGSSSESNSSAAQKVEAALPFIRTGSAVAAGAVLDFAVTDATTRQVRANQMYASANAVYTMTGAGTFPTVAQFQATLQAYDVANPDPAYLQYVSAVSTLYASFYPKLVANQNVKLANDVLNAIAAGIQDATASYVSTSTTTMSSTANAEVAAAVPSGGRSENGGPFSSTAVSTQQLSIATLSAKLPSAAPPLETTAATTNIAGA